MKSIPKQGLSKEETLALIDDLRKDDLTETERTFAYVYDAGKEAKEVALAAQAMMANTSGLDPTVYPSVLRLENEIVSMAAAHLESPEGVAGNFTSGGTESIMLAVKSARDHARKTRPEIEKPTMVLPLTAHPAHVKAAHYLGIEPVFVPVDPETMKADAKAIEAAIDDRTILLVGSAPSYAHGVVDPIEELGAIAAKRDIWLHVDACIGGFLLPYFRRLGDDIPRFGFEVPGVCSLSMDLHKYAYAPKGASVLLYRNKELRKNQLFVHAEWPGYTMINTTIQSTKSAGPMAGALAVLRFLGDEGFLDLARKTRDASRRLMEGIEAIDGLEIVGKPQMSLIAIRCEASPFVIADEMKKRNWYVQPQLACEGHEETLHLSVHPGNHDWVDPFLEDLAASVRASADKNVDASGLTAAFGGVDPESLTTETVMQMLSMVGVDGFSLPDEMAEINAVLNALPRGLSERLILEFVNELYTTEAP